jgi:pimeloyl-ACP methyl ester carboxylesterase
MPCASRSFALAFCLAACAAKAPPPPAQLPHVSERPHQVAHVGAVDIAWDTFGDPHGKPLLLVMGLGLQMIAWSEPFCETLAARGFYVIRFDNRDAGLSTHFTAAGDPDPLQVWDELRKKRAVEPPYRLVDMANDAVGVLEAAHVQAAHVVGVSMGGMIAQELAIHHPERVLTLTSIMSNTGDPTVRGPSFETIGALLAPFPPEREAFIRRSLEVARTLHGGGQPFDEDDVRRTAARSFDRAFDPGGVRRQLVAIWLSGDRTAALQTLALPVLVIHGDADPLVPVDGGRATARAIPGARLEIIAGMGHELPRAVWPRVLDLITANAASRP